MIAGTVRNGVEVPDRVIERDQLGMREEDWPDTPEGREALDAEWAALEPVVLTDEERAANEAWRQVMKKLTE